MSSKNDIENDIEINDIEIIIDNGTLTNQQKTIVLKIYNKVKNNVSEIITVRRCCVSVLVTHKPVGGRNQL